MRQARFPSMYFLLPSWSPSAGPVSGCGVIRAKLIRTGWFGAWRVRCLGSSFRMVVPTNGVRSQPPPLPHYFDESACNVRLLACPCCLPVVCAPSLAASSCTLERGSSFASRRAGGRLWPTSRFACRAALGARPLTPRPFALPHTHDADQWPLRAECLHPRHHFFDRPCP